MPIQADIIRIQPHLRKGIRLVIHLHADEHLGEITGLLPRIDVRHECLHHLALPFHERLVIDAQEGTFAVDSGIFNARRLYAADIHLIAGYLLKNIVGQVPLVRISAHERRIPQKFNLNVIFERIAENAVDHREVIHVLFQFDVRPVDGDSQYVEP